MAESTTNSKTFSVRYAPAMDAKVLQVMQYNMTEHGFMPSRNTVLNTAVSIGLDEMVKSYQGGLTNE